MARKTVCPICKQSFDRDLEEFVFYKKRYYHKACFDTIDKDVRDREELEEYIRQVYNIEKMTPLINKQIKEFHEQGMSYSGIYKTLYYFYTIKNQKLGKAKGIGIVEYTYEEARNYFKEMFDIEQNNANIDKPVLEKVKIIIAAPKAKPTRKRKVIKLKNEEEEI